MRNRYLILNYIFIFCLLILVLNDHVFKTAFSNIVTGKLSDIAGIILLPLLLTYLFPALRHHSIWVSAVLFTFWKCPFSTGLIEAYNSIAPVQITRVVDYTDLLVFIFLPAPWYLIKNIDQMPAVYITRLHPSFVLVPVMAALMATSPPYQFNYYQLTDGELVCLDCYITIRLNEAEIVRKLNDNNIYFDSTKPLIPLRYKDDSFDIKPVNYYRIKRLVIDNDTIRDLDFTMRMMTENKTRIYFNGMKMTKNTNYWHTYYKVRRSYWNKVFRELKDKIE